MNCHWLIVLFITTGAVCISGAATGPSSHDDGSYSHYISDAYYYAYDWLAGSLDNCPFRENMMESIKHNLERHIKGQNEGLETILSAISAWEFQRQSGQSEPLVLALTGPTGVGKSETSFRLAEGALAKRSKVGKSLKYRPNGLLTLRGEDYTEGSLAVIHESIRDRVIDHLEACSGNAVIVFDEVQKVLPGTLEVLMPAFETRGSLSRTRQVAVESALESTFHIAKRLFYTAPKADDSKTQTKPVTTMYSTENVIFIFISDIGADTMTKLVLTYGNRSAIPHTLLRNEVKTALDDQWSRLQFGKVVREVVPYLPLEPEHIRDILRTKLSNLGADHKMSHWRDLVVDEDVIIYLSDPPLVKYSKYSTKRAARPASGGASSGGDSGNSECSTDSAGNTQCGASSSSSSGGGSTSSGSGGTTTTKLFATWGARSLENAGPLQDLKGKLSRYAQPWRPDQILHVGLATEANREKRNLRWGTQEKPGTAAAPGAAKTIYIQWCKMPRPSAGGAHNKNLPSEGLDEPSHSEDSDFVITDEIAFSDACETKWFGPLVG